MQTNEQYPSPQSEEGQRAHRFDFYNSDYSRDDEDDDEIIPAQQATNHMTRGPLLPCSDLRFEQTMREIVDQNAEQVAQHEAAQQARISNKQTRPRPPNRPEYVDLHHIAQAQKTAVYTTNAANRAIMKQGKRKRRTSQQNSSESSNRSGTSNEESTSGGGEGRRQRRRRTSQGSISSMSEEALALAQRANASPLQQPNSGSCGDDSEHSSRRRRATSRASKNGSPEGFAAKKVIEQEKARVLQLIQAQEECFACMWARKDYDKVDKEDIDLLENFFRNRYARMNRKAFCSVLSKLYQAEIQMPYAARGLVLPDWSKEMIEEHILYHELDPEIVFTEVLQTFFTTFMEIQNSFFVEKKVTVTTVDEHEVDPVSGEPLKCEYEITKWVPDTKNIRCGIEVAKALEGFFKLSNSEFAPERKRTRVKNLSPSLVCAERVRFSAK